MSKYIRAVVVAKAIEEKYGIPLGDLVDTFADIPDRKSTRLNSSHS